MTLPIDGGESKRISEELVSNGFDISPDGKTVAAAFGHMAEHVEGLIISPIASQQMAKSLDFQHPRSGPLRFSPDGRAVVYPARTAGVDNLWLQPLDDGSPGKQITNFTSEHINDFHWSFDGSKLAMIRGLPIPTLSSSVTRSNDRGLQRGQPSGGRVTANGDRSSGEPKDLRQMAGSSVTEDGVDYLGMIGKQWGALCGSQEIASLWADEILGDVISQKLNKIPMVFPPRMGLSSSWLLEEVE